MRVKINRVRGGSMGDQRDYGLVTGSIWNHELEPDTNRVSDVLRPVPRDEANIEAERGETIVGDLDQDGMVEHAIVGGKRHFQGGTPLNVPDGSYVFSDYNKLKIRNKDILKGIFNYGGKGATPAQIAKRYELNKYKDILNDPEADPLDKKTAQLMLDNNMMKLAQLALVQEGMKGFPDGIPDIALPLLGSDIAQARPSQQEDPMMARRGGLVKYQSKGPVKGDRYEAEMKKFKDWEKRWKNALVKNDTNQIQQLKSEGTKLSEILNSVDIPFNLPINFSFLDPNTRRVSWGTQEGKLADAADVIDNYLNFWEKAGKNASRGATHTKENFQAKTKANALYKDALNIISDYETKGGSTTYNVNDITNAYNIIKELSPKDIYTTGEPGYSSSDINYNYVPLQEIGLKNINNLITKYPIKSTVPSKSINPGDVAMDMSDTTRVSSALAPNVVTYNTGTNEVGTLDTAKTTTNTAKTTTPSAPIYTDAQLIEIIKSGTGDTVVTPEQLMQARLVYNVKKLGGSLPKHQGTTNSTTGPIAYDLRDKIFNEAAKKKKQVAAQPWTWYNPDRTVVGSQLYLQPSGVYGFKGAPTIEIDQLKNYKGVKWDDYNGGFDQWKKDLAAAKGNRDSKANKFYLENRKKYETEKTGMSSIDEQKQGWNVPGFETYTPYEFSDVVETPPATTPVADVSNKSNTQMQGIKAPDYSGSGYPSPWTDYSLVDYYTALSNAASVNRGPLPPYATYSPSVGRPTFLDPARAIAQQQGLTAQTQEQIGAISDPTVARANMIAASAKSSPDIANIMSQYDNQNAQIANQFNQQATNTYNDASLKNIGMRDNYAERLTTRDQQYENAMRDARTKVAGSYKRGAVDAREWAGMNQTNPNYYYDQFGNIRFKPGYDPTKGGLSSTSDSVAQMMKTYMQDYGLTAEQAAALIKAQFQRKSGVGASNPVDEIWG